jgi:hypothetical protein
MKKFVPLIFFALFPLISFGQKNYRQDLGRIAVITFPDTPKTTDLKPGLFYSVKKDEIVFFASVSEIHNSFNDHLTKHLIDSLYAAVIVGSLKRPDAKLIYKKNILVDNLKGIEYGFRSQKNLMTYYHYHRVIYINHTLIAYGLTSFDSLKNNNKELYDFYATFKVILPHSQISQQTIADALFNFKTVMWATIALLAGVLIIFVIKKLT